MCCLHQRHFQLGEVGHLRLLQQLTLPIVNNGYWLQPTAMRENVPLASAHVTILFHRVTMSYCSHLRIWFQMWIKSFALRVCVHYQVRIRIYILPRLASRVYYDLLLLTCSDEVVGPGREGPMMFGDEDNGHSFAYVFKLNDSQARGFQRWMSLVFIERSHIKLVASWQYLNLYVLVFYMFIYFLCY